MTQTPHLLCISAKDSVCLTLFSLAVTNSISIDFFSCRYLNVSIPCVPSPYGANAEVALGYPWFKAYVQLPMAYRSLSRPSSALEPSHPPNSSDCSLCYRQKPMHGFMNFNLHRPKKVFWINCALGRHLSLIS